MLHFRTIVERDGVTIADVACRDEHGRGEAIEHSGVHALVFVRRGCFTRVAGGAESVLDPTVAYCMNPGDEQRFDHPHGHGDDCTAVFLDPALAASLWGGDPVLPAAALPTSPAIDFEQRLLLAGSADPYAAVERAIALVAGALGQADEPRVQSGRPSTAAVRRALVDGARELLAADPEASLPELSRTLAVSPHHLSRIFRAATGHTIARHRMRLRARAALERLGAGEDDLGRMAADLGFADQSHMWRVMRAETGHAPSVARRLLLPI